MSLALGAGLLAAGAAVADPLVKMEGGKASPGIVTAWSGSGKKVELTVAAGKDAQAVAAAIEAHVSGVRCKVQGGKVLAIGKAEGELLEALAGVDFGGEEDMTLLAAAAMEGESDSGSSLRAKTTADLKKLLGDRATVAQGQVVSIVQGAFPEVTVSVRVLSGPTGELGKTVRKGQTIAFTPTFTKKNGQLDLAHTPTQTNLGAFFLKAGDRVTVKVGKATPKGFEAELITR
jgi:hypothetical protein